MDLECNQDVRGFLARYWCQKELSELGLSANIAQINNSVSSKKGTLRGLHFQGPPKAEVKIVRCIRGAIWDVIVDIRAGSPTFGGWYGRELTAENRTMMYVPQGFAHGFQTLTDNVEQLYLHSEFYSPEHDVGLQFDDPTVAIEWPVPITEVSSRDRNQPYLKEITPVII